jgi:argininosuccinate lyase
MSEEKKLWGGRFTGEADENFVRFNQSFGFDQRLFKADIRGCLAHCGALRRAEVLTRAEADAIQKGLEKLLEQSETDSNFFADSSAEDVHSFIESQLDKIVGDVGRKLHTGRSRNDQVATALRLWLREKTDELANDLRNTQESLLDLAEKHQTAVLPGYTHLQRAQPILFAHWCLAYFEMFKRDAVRLFAGRKHINVLPLGAAALAGTSYPIDRQAVARDLGFEAISENSLDAVSDRDFAVEFASAAALIMMHLSRLAEDIIIYSTTEFGFFELSDAVATGSSLMPQKKNPDSMELVRGKSARVFGNLMTLLTMLKGLPMAYNKDMQEDKEAVFDTFDTTRNCLRISATVLQHIQVREEATRNAALKGYLNATELADYLSKKDIPFRDAHELAGKIVLRAIDEGVELNALDLSEMQKYSPKIEADVYDALSLRKTLETKNTTGGTAPKQVKKALRKARLNLSGNVVG